MDQEDFTRAVYIILIGAITIMGLTACERPNPVSPLPTPNANATVIWSDDFSLPNTSWARFDVAEGAAYIQNGEFYLEDRGGKTAVYSPYLDQALSNITVDTQIRHVQGSVNNWMGILCHQQDEDNYYLLAISADGYYLILRVEEGENTPLVGPTESGAIHTGKARNHVQAGCYEDRLTLTVNDTLLVTYNDDTLPNGNIALFADALDAGNTTTIAFDHIMLLTP